MSAALRARRRLDGAMLLLVVIWGVNFPIIKRAFVDLPPFAFNGLRFLIAGAVLAVVLRLLEGPRPLTRADLPGLALLGLFGHVGYQSLFMSGLARTTAGHSSLIIAMVPLFVGALGVALGLERPSARMWTGLAVAFIGVVILVRGRADLVAGGGTLTGDLLTLGAAICWAAYTVLSRPLLGRFSPLRLATVTLLLGLPVILGSALPSLIGLNWRAVSGQSWAALAFSALCAVVVSYIIWNVSVHATGSTRTAAFSNLIPVVALVSAWALLGEPLSVVKVVGGAVVLFGVWVARGEGRPT